MTPRRSPGLSFALGAPVGTLGGLIGLGGAEFRLPLLVGVLRYQPRAAVPLNLAVSLFTVTAGAATRLTTGGQEGLVALGEIGAVVVSLLAGGMIGAYIGATWLARVTDVALERIILTLLVGIGGLLIYEAFTAWEPDALVSSAGAIAGVGLLCGLGIGLVSSMLGVAGGELIIPTLILVFGVDIKLAGTASLLISLPTILVGLYRHRQKGAFREPADLRKMVVPMGAGSVLGAILGGILVAYISSSMLKLLLGALLIGSAIKVFSHRKP